MLPKITFIAVFLRHRAQGSKTPSYARSTPLSASNESATRVINQPTENTARAQSLVGELLAVMAALRAPGTGCPWDIEQTFATIAPYTIEEAYEVGEAIEKNDMRALKEEL